MKKKNLFSRMLLLLAITVGSTSVWGQNQDVVFDFQQDENSYGWSGTPAASSDLEVGDCFTNDIVTFTYTAKGGQNPLRWWSTGDGLRSYKGNKFKIATSSGTIESITITGTCVLKEASSTGGTIANSRNWTKPEAGGVTEVEFECNQSSGNKTIKKVTVTIAPPPSEDPSSDFTFTMENKTATIELPGTTTYTGTFTTANGYNGTITYELSNNTCGATINQQNGMITVTKKGSVTVKGMAEAIDGSFSYSEDTYTLTVEDNRQDPEIAWSSSAEVRIAQYASDGDYTLPTLSNPNNLAVTYSSTNEDVAVEVDGYILVDTDVLGSTTITATFEGDDDYFAASKSFKITVYDSYEKGEINNPYTVAEVIALDPTSTSIAVKSNVYVKGFIIGAVSTSGSSAGDISDTPNDIDTNLAIADSPTETTNYCTVQLPSGDIRKALSTKNHTYNIGVAQVLVKGNIKKYCEKPGVRDLSEGYKVAEKVTVSDVGVGTYSTDVGLDFTGTGITAYTAEAGGTSVALKPINGGVPANTGVVLKANGGASALVPVATTTATLETNEMLPNVARAQVALAGSNGKTNYILSNEAAGVGFYLAAENGAYLPAHRAYLSTTTTGNAPFLGFDGEGTTGIVNVNRETITNNQYYTLDGRRVENPSNGIYIVNGKKVVVK